MERRMAEYVRAIAQMGSMTKAAQSLFVSQPALTQAVQRLEAALGVKIFEKKQGKLVLTYAGERYVDAMKRVAAIYNDLQHEVGESGQEIHGEIRLGISMQRSMQLLPLIIPSFSQKYPRVRILLEEFGSGTLEKMLHDGMCDIALITTSPHYEDIMYRLLETEEVLLMASKTTMLAQKKPDGSTISIFDAVDERFVTLDRGHSVRVIQDKLFFDTHISPNILLETENLEAAKRVAAAADAVMLCPDVFIAQSPEVKQAVHCYRIKEITTKRHFYFAYRKEMYFARFMQDLFEIIKGALGVFDMHR